MSDHQSSPMSGNLWMRLMGTAPGMARRRRWALSLALVFGLVVLLLLSPADPSRMLGALFGAANLGHLIILTLAFWIALRAAAGSVQAIFEIESYRDAQRHILQSAFNGRYSTLHVEGGHALSENADEAILKAGGPGRVHIHMENAAVFERVDGERRVIAPGQDDQILSGFERLRAVLDLRDQVLNLNLWARTRDGIRVEVEGARLVYSIARGRHEARLSAPHPFDRAAALRLVYGRRVERGSHSPGGAKPVSILGEQGAAFFERQMQAFIGELTLGELLAAPSASSPPNEEKTDALFLARDAIRHQFTARCEAAAAKEGLQLHWVDVGTWRLDELAQEILEDYLEERQPEMQTASINPYQESRSLELNRLFEELAAIKPKTLNETQPSAVLAQLISAYYGLFDGLKLRYGELLGKDEGQIETVLRHLDGLSKRLEHPS